jgi:putative PEP-CTERM system histidine kinase
MGLGISVFAGLLAALAYAAFAVVLPLRGKHSWPSYLFASAAAMTALWALSRALYDDGLAAYWAPRVAGALRDGAWFAVTIGLLQHDNHKHPLWRKLAIAASVVIAVDLGFAAINASFDTGLGITLNVPSVQLATSVMGLILTENLARNLSRSRYWSAKSMLIGVTALFGYQIVLRIPEFLGGRSIESFLAAQPLIYFVVLPLFVVTAVRNDSLRLQLHSSRNVVFHSATLIFAGILLLGTAAAAYYVRQFGGTPALVLSIVLGFTGLVAMIVVVSTHAVRSQIKAFINENFFSYKYDYRLEWTKFIQALSRYEELSGPDRALLILSDLLDSPGGALWIKRSGWKQFVRLAYSAFGEEFGPIHDDDKLLAGFENESAAFLELSSKADSPNLTEWRKRFPGAWLVVPLRFRDEFIGFALLHKPRAPRRLDWEDRNLVAMIATQLAAYLVHEHTAQALADSQQVAEFNNRVTFALHDLKNTTGQLSLLLHNAERFGDDAAFRTDMMATIRNVVEKLQGLISKLRGDETAAVTKTRDRINVGELVERFAKHKAQSGLIFGGANGSGAFYAEVAKPGTFESALEHIVANAIEASPSPGSIQLHVDRQNDRVRVRVCDRGPGMTPEFIAHELFRPLRTTKRKGLGIGAYQARTMMRDLGGDIEVESKPGEGTTVTLLLPACTEPESQTTG